MLNPTFTITTLLKAGNEDPVEKLMGKASAIMADITDEFKIAVCLNFPTSKRVCPPSEQYKGIRAGTVSCELSEGVRSIEQVCARQSKEGLVLPLPH